MRRTRAEGAVRRFFRCWFLVGALLGAVASAQAQSPSSYPDRPIRLVVAFPPGGATDTLTRQITQELGEALAQSVVTNVPTLTEAGVKSVDVDLRFWFGIF